MASRRAVRGLRRTLLALVLHCLSLATVRLSRAEEPQSSPLSPAGPVVSAPVGSEPAGTEQDETLARARAVVAVAEPLFLAEQYPAALAEYARAYEILAGHPRQYWVLHNLAACNERMFRYDVAVELYEEYLRRAPPTEEDRKEVSAVLQTLRSLLATLVVESSVAGEVWLDDRRLGAAPGKWRVAAGRHSVDVRAHSYESQRKEVQLSAGQVDKERFELQRLSVNAGPPPAYFWGAVVLTGVATLVGASSGLNALNAREQGRQKAALYLDTQAEGERTRRWALASDIGFGAAALFGATATVLYFVTDWQKSGLPARRAREPRAPRSVTVTLATPVGLGASVAGQF